MCKLRCKQGLSRGWEGKRRIATDSVEGRCGVLLRQTDRHGGPVEVEGRRGGTDTETAQIHVLLVLLKPRSSLLQQLLVCFKGRPLLSPWPRRSRENTKYHEWSLQKVTICTHIHRHPRKTALWSCSLLPFHCSHPSITKEKVQNIYYTAPPLPTLQLCKDRTIVT